MSPRLILGTFALVLAAALLPATSVRAQAPPPIDPCLQCGLIYASAGPGDLYSIDPDTNTATFIGTSFPNFTDIAITQDGRLFGMSFDGDLYLISACDGSASPFDTGYYGSGLTGDPATPDDLFVAGPPLGRIDTATGSIVYIGGNTLGPPPLWCGPMSGDIVVHPIDGLLYGTLQCTCASGGDMLVTIDPATGDIIEEIGCLEDSAGIGYVAFGLVVTDDCRLIASPPSGPFLLEVDPETAAVTQIPIAGALDGGFGLALLRCPDAGPCIAAPPICEPLTQGFWKRQCKGPHPSGEHELLDSYGPCVAASATFGSSGSGTRDGLCRELDPNPARAKCEHAEAQFMALLLNTCSERLSRDCCIDSDTTSATTVGAAIDEIDALLSNPGRTSRDCVRAQAIADAINTGQALCSGSI